MTFKSLAELKKVALRSEIVEMEIPDIKFLLDEKGLNSLVFTEPFSKTCFTCSTVSSFLSGSNVIYIDLDTVFTAYVRNNIFTFPEDSGYLSIYMPRASEFEESLADICSAIDSNSKLVIVDSINSFYHLYYKIRIGALNHLLSSYVLLLLNHCRRVGSRLLVTSMIRHKKTTEWVLAPSSRRLLESKSSAVLAADLLYGNLAINILKHRELGNSKLLIRKEMIPILP
ncbi:MAG: hypothetical protein QXU32_10020 [Nitrososphaerales archaeon]